jgi:hypothetical protein
MEKIKSLIIGGSNHSGTTMMSKVFNNHSGTYGAHGESRFLDSFQIIKSDYIKLDPKHRIKYLADKLYFGNKFKKNKFHLKTVKSNPLLTTSCLKIISTEIRSDVNTIIQSVGKDLKKQLFVEKSPSNVYHIDDAFELLENCYVLIVQRDVRDVICSLKERYFTLKNSPEVFAHNIAYKKYDKDYNFVVDSIMWNKAVLSWFKIENNNLKAVKYEDYVINPSSTTSDLCDWIGINFEPDMINLQQRNSSNQAFKNEKGITESSVRKFRSLLKLEEIAMIQFFSGNVLKKLGYELEFIPFITKLKLVYLIPFELLKIPVRVYKRFRLMNLRYFLNFCKRAVKKLFIK